MMNMMISAMAAPLPGFARAALFALLAIAAVGGAQLWHHASVDPSTPAVTSHLAQPLAAAPSPADMWRF
jgi:hypothetical protein